LRLKYEIVCDTIDCAQSVFGFRVLGFFVHIKNYLEGFYVAFKGRWNYLTSRRELAERPA